MSKKPSKPEMEKHYFAERGLPHNPEAERAILGTVLLDQDVLSECAAEFLRVEDFALDSHRKTYTVMLDMQLAQQRIDLVTISAQMQAAFPSGVAEVGGVSYLASLTEGLPRRTSVKNYITIVKDCSRRRMFMNAMQLGLEMAQDPSEATSWSMNTVMEKLLEILGDHHKQLAQSVGEFGMDVLRELMELRDARRAGKRVGLTFGIEGLDESTTGIRKGEYIVIGAFTSAGKTSAAIKIAVDNAREGHGVAFFSIEMPRSQIYNRIMSYVSDVHYSKFRDPKFMSDRDLETIAAAKEEVDKLPIYVDECTGIDAAELVSRARLYVARHNIKVTIVDYLQLVSGNPGDKIFETVSRASGALRQFSKESGVPSVALSQLARPDVRDRNVRPNLTMLRGSGNIEQDANLILMLYRPIDPETNDPTGEDEIIIEKNRAGAIGVERVRFDVRTLTYRERHWVREDNPKQIGIGV